MPNRLMLIPGALLAAFSASCGGGADADRSAGQADDPGGASPGLSLPSSIVADRGGFIPEGIEYDELNGRILTGSLTEGSIMEIHPDGRVSAVVTDPELVSSVGIEADEPRGRLLVANADRRVFEGASGGQAKLGIYDLATGDRIAMVDLAASIGDGAAGLSHFANDVAVGDDGTAYVTDTMAGIIYRVDAEYRASVLYRSDAPEPPGWNGIVAHPDGYLLAAAGSTLWKVPIADPESAAPVVLPEEIPGQDGMVWTADGRLAIVSNSTQRLVALTSSDGWATADLAGVGTFEPQGTTVAVVGEELYVVHPHFADADPPSVSRVTLR